MSKVKIKHDDKVIFEDMSHLSFDTDDVNIQVEHSDAKGFCVSVFDRKKKTMCYYDIVDGQLKLSSKEDTDSGEEMLMRDDIKDRVNELIKSNFTSMKFIVQEHYTWMDMDMTPDEVNALSEMLIEEFSLVGIEFSRVMEWQKVADVINYIETALEDQDGN